MTIFYTVILRKKFQSVFTSRSKSREKISKPRICQLFKSQTFSAERDFFYTNVWKNKRYFQNSFLYLNINWYLNSNRVLTKIWGRIEFKLSSNRVLHRVEKQIPFLHSYILYYCFNLIANESFDELCNTFRIRKKKKCKTHNFFCVKLPKLFSCDFLHVHFYNPNFFLLCNFNCCF